MNGTALQATDKAGATVDAAVAAELDERRLRVVSDQAARLRWQIVSTVLVVLAVAAPSVPAAILLPWSLAVIGVREWRVIVLRRLVADRAAPVARRLQISAAWNLALGVVNGSAALFMAWLDTTGDALLTMVLVSWGAGAVSTSSTAMRAFLAYAAPMFVPTAAMWLLLGQWLGAGVGLLVLMFFGVQVRFARQNLETFETSFLIRQENEALARSLQAERSALALARDAAVQANLDKSRFLAGASHDLRQPLQALALNADELMRRRLPGDGAQIAADVGASVEQLRSMLDALLDVSKLDAGGVVPEIGHVRLDRMVDAVTASFRAAALARGVALEGRCPSGLAVRADADLLRRMLANLLDNAIKFTAGCDRREVHVDMREVGDEVEITVADSGPGIAAEHHQLVFDDLVRLPSAGPRGGHGLGLGIVRRAAALLGTRVELDSALGSGARFRWRLPRSDGLDALPGAGGGDWSIAGRGVLVLDDDAMVRGAYRNGLAGLGAVTSAAAHVDEALAVLATTALDVALVDFRLGPGDGDGLQVIDALRRASPGLPIVMLSADSGDALAEAARLRSVPLLRKPVDVLSLGRALAAAIAGRGEREEV